MKYLILTTVLIASASSAQEPANLANNNTQSPNIARANAFIDCGDNNSNKEFSDVDDFVEILKGGLSIEPSELVNNPLFINPCFKERASQYETSFHSLTELAMQISEFNVVEHAIISKTNEKNSDLGKTRAPIAKRKPPSTSGSQAVSAKPVKKAPTYSKNFSEFKKKAKLIGTVENGNVFLAHLSYNNVPLNDIKVGSILKGVEVIEIGFGFVKFKDTTHSGKTSTIWVGA